jgi:hypothetical protein
MKRWILALTLALAVAIVGCQQDRLARVTNQVQQGMSQEEVLKAVGDPDAKSTGAEGMEMWLWRDASNPQRAVGIAFDEGRVVRIDSRL